MEIWKTFGRRLLHFEDEPDPYEVVPGTSIIDIDIVVLVIPCELGVCIVIFEALFVSWSAGVDLPITVASFSFELLPTLALAILFQHESWLISVSIRSRLR